MNSIEGVEAKSFPIEDVDVEFVREAKCVVFGSPIYAAHITGQMMNYLLSEAGKLGFQAVPSQYPHFRPLFS